jgi:protein-L-isoaspartate(D-aspartate) O-methyltransferase
LQADSYISTNDIRDLYHDVLVVLKGEQFLNNGQPSMIAKFMAALNLSTGKRVVHIGCGTGYYTAILAEIIGLTGEVVALEIESDLAARAAANLESYANVKVLHRDGATIAPGPADAILVNAGVTHLPFAWLDCLKESGVLVAPFLVGRSSASRDALALRIVRKGQRYQAELLTVLTIYPGPSLQDPAIQAQLNASFESHDMLRLKSFRVDAHDRTDTCLVHTPTFCLSAEGL